MNSGGSSRKIKERHSQDGERASDSDFDPEEDGKNKSDEEESEGEESAELSALIRKANNKAKAKQAAAASAAKPRKFVNMSVDASKGSISSDEVKQVDVLLGRGKRVSEWPGNIHFRQIVNRYRERYSTTTRSHKVSVAAEVMAEIHSEPVGGRFLAETVHGSGQWLVVKRDRAIEKICQALREKEKARTPANVDPFTDPRRKVRLSVVAIGSGDAATKPAAARRQSTPARKAALKTAVEPAATKRKSAPPSVGSSNLTKKRHRDDDESDEEEEYSSSEEEDDGNETEDTDDSAKALERFRERRRLKKLGIEPPTSSSSSKKKKKKKRKKEKRRSSKKRKREGRATSDEEEDADSDVGGAMVLAVGSGEPTKVSKSSMLKPNSKTHGTTGMVVPSIHDKSKSSRPATRMPHSTRFVSPLPRKSLDSFDHDDLLEQLEQFQKKYGHTAVPPLYTKRKELAEWCSAMRALYRQVKSEDPYREATELENDLLEKLEKMAFVWNYEEWHWNHQYATLAALSTKVKQQDVSEKKLPADVKQEMADVFDDTLAVVGNGDRAAATLSDIASMDVAPHRRQEIVQWLRDQRCRLRSQTYQPDLLGKLKQLRDVSIAL